MPNAAQVTEALLRCLTSRDRAQAITGDLLESHQSVSPSRFIFAVVRLLLALLWRPSLAAVTSVVLGLTVSASLFFAAAHRIPFSTPLVLFQAMRFADCSTAFSALAAFTVVRYGLRNRAWPLSLACTLLTIACVVSFWSPQELSGARPVLFGLFLLLLIPSLLTRSSRTSTGLVFASVSFYFVTKRGLEFLFARLVHLYYPRVAHLSPHAVHFVETFGVLSLLLPFLAECYLYTRLHNRFEEPSLT